MGPERTAEQHTEKKIRATVREPNVAIYMLRCVELGLTKDLLEIITVGDVYDMCVEKANDNEEYPIKATQEDIGAFFGG